MCSSRLVNFRMETCLDALSPAKVASALHPWKHVFIFGAAVTAVYLSWKVYEGYTKKQRRKKWASVGKDVVILHQMARGRYTPNISPFPLKLETYLRMSGIPYESDFDEPLGSKQKTPWISLNGEEIPDSQICMELLGRKFRKDFSSHLSSEEQATAYAYQMMMEEHFYWVLATWRWVYQRGTDLGEIMPSFPWILRTLLVPLISYKMKGAAWGQGIGRHKEAEVMEMGMKDLKALSSFLGTKPFLMGDEPIEVDCAIFGMLAQVLWNTPKSPFEQVLNGEFINLKDYCIRMKEKFWPDWDRCLDPPRI